MVIIGDKYNTQNDVNSAPVDPRVLLETAEPLALVVTVCALEGLLVRMDYHVVGQLGWRVVPVYTPFDSTRILLLLRAVNVNIVNKHLRMSSTCVCTQPTLVRLPVVTTVGRKVVTPRTRELTPRFFTRIFVGASVNRSVVGRQISSTRAPETASIPHTQNRVRGLVHSLLDFFRVVGRLVHLERIRPRCTRRPVTIRTAYKHRDKTATHGYEGSPAESGQRAYLDLDMSCLFMTGRTLATKYHPQ
jgi:hypothetical protein